MSPTPPPPVTLPKPVPLFILRLRNKDKETGCYEYSLDCSIGGSMQLHILCCKTFNNEQHLLGLSRKGYSTNHKQPAFLRINGKRREGLGEWC